MTYQLRVDINDTSVGCIVAIINVIGMVTVDIGYVLE